MISRWITAILVATIASACGATGGKISQEQALSQIKGPPPKSLLQDQLLAQLSRTTLTGYRDYEVGPEDLLEISHLGLNELNLEVRVTGQGEISLPLVGAVPVSGLTPQKIEARLVKLYREGEYLINPQITVLVKEYRHQRVMVTGAVAQPGSYEVIGPRTLLEMLGKAGGLSEKAGDMVHIIRAQSAAERTRALKGAPTQSFSPGTETIVVDLRRLLLKGALELNLPIRNGDVIHVPFAQSAYVLGAVNRAGSVPVRENLTVSQAVALAGGTNPLLASDQVTIVRLNEQGQRLTIPVNLKNVVAGSEADVLLRENDVVYVHESGFRRFLYNFKSLMPGSFGATIPVF